MKLVDILAKLEAGPEGGGDSLLSNVGGLDRLRQVVQEEGGLPISLDCRTKILDVCQEDLEEVIIPLCAWLKGLAEVNEGGKERDERILVGIVGAAAAGKSTLAQLLCAAGDVAWGTSRVQCFSMDGYSFPNSHLSTQRAEDDQGRPCSLKDIKGLPRTLDAEALLRDLRRLHRPSTQTVRLPAYSRDLHDPVPDSVAVDPQCRVVIVEGLHLLHNEGKWKDISEALHRTVFLDIERSCCFERVVGRKVANGRARESSEAHFARVDGPTFDRLQEDKGNATLILTMRPTMARPLHIFKVDVPSV